MKRKLSLFLAIALLAAIILPVAPTVRALDPVTIYVASTGDDTNAGTETAPVRTINQAYKLIYAARNNTNNSGTVSDNIIMVMDDLGQAGIKRTGGPTYISGTGVWTARVNATIRGANDSASVNLTVDSATAVVFTGSTVFDNINIDSDNWFEYGCYLSFYYSLLITDTVTTSGDLMTMNFVRCNSATINGGSWDNIYAGSVDWGTNNATKCQNVVTIGEGVSVNNLYAAGAPVRNSGTLTCGGTTTMNLNGCTVNNLYLAGRTRAKYQSNIHSNVLTNVAVNLTAGKLTNLYLGGTQDAADSGAINVTSATVNQTGGTIENVFGGKSAEGCTAANNIGTLNATFLDTNAINFEISSMPTTAMNLNFGKTTVNFDADDLAAIKASGATETTLTLGKADATTEGYEEAYSVAMSGITATADVTLTLGNHIKTANVLNAGNTVAMGSDKKVAFTGATLGLFEIDILAANAATIGDAEYNSFKDALAAAVSGDTINLMADANLAGETIVLMPGVQIYLGEFDLTAKTVIGLEGAAIGGTAIDGKLYVEKNLLKVDSAFTYADGRQSIPVWNEDHYTFAVIDFQKTEKTVDGDTLKYTFAQVAYYEIEELMAASATDCGLDVQIKLTWMVGEQEFSVVCDYTDAAITTVCSSDTAMYNMYLPGFTALGIDADTVVITPMVVSSTGAVVAL